MFDPVGSTTWPRRNADTFRQLSGLRGMLPDVPTILIVGPGGAVRRLLRWLPDGTRPTRGISRFARTVVRGLDQVLRRVPGVPLVSPETMEVCEALGPACRLIVADRSRRVLAAIRRDHPQATTRCIDIAREQFNIQADVVIAFNIVSRASDGESAVRSITGAVKPNGLLLIDDRSYSAHLAKTGHFRRVCGKIHQRTD